MTNLRQSDLGRDTLQLSDLGRADYKQISAYPVSNARAIKEGISIRAIRRYGRVGGYERDFEAKDALRTDPISVKSRVVATRTAAGSHGAFLYTANRRPPSGLKVRLLAVPRVGAESRCYTFNTKSKGFTFQTIFCVWRQSRLVGEIVATGFWGRKGFSTPLITPVKQIVAKQARRMVG